MTILRIPPIRIPLLLRQLRAQQPQQYFVGRARILRVILEARTLEVLHQIGLAVGRVLLLVISFGYRVAVDEYAAVRLPVSQEWTIHIVACRSSVCVTWRCYSCHR